MKNQRRGIFDLVLGAMMLAIFIILYLIVPGGNSSVQSVLILVTCLPLTLYTLSCGIKKAGIVVLAGTALSVLFLQPVILLSYAVPSLLIGILSGLAILKCKKATAVVIMAVLHLAQNCFEIYLADVILGIRFADTYTAIIDKAIELASIYVTSEMLLTFANDFLLCCVPVALLLGAAAKGIIMSFIVDYLKRSKYFKFQDSEQKSQKPLLSEKLITWAYLLLLAVQAAVTTVFLTGATAYHFVFPALSVLTLTCALGYLYYYNCAYIRGTALPQKQKLLRSGLLLVLFPLTMFAAPVQVLLKAKD